MKKPVLFFLSSVLCMHIFAALTITCPQNIVQDNSNRAIHYKVVITDNCTATPNLVSTHPSGTEFPIGTTDVVVTATDKCGNVESCIFTATILNDNPAEKPVTAIADLKAPVVK